MVLPSTPAPATPSERVEYQPLSLLAIFGLGLAALYAGALLVAVVVAVIQATPLFLAGWFHIVPVIGALLCLLGYWQIHSSEGTLAGKPFAIWGIWLSLLAGLGYAAYEVATALALRQQADRFLTVKDADSGFFPRLLAGEINSAFLLTQSPTLRAGANPADVEGMTRQFDAPQGVDPKGKLTYFGESELVQLLLQAGKEEQKPMALGTQSWKFEQQSFQVERTFQLTTSLVRAEISTTIRSMESGEPGSGRKWFVSLQGTGITRMEFTRAGEELMRLRASGQQFLGLWPGLTDTPEQTKSYPKIETDLATLRPPEGVARSAVQQEIRDLFSSTYPVRQRMQLGEGRFGPWQRTPEGKLEISYTFTLPLQLDSRGSPRTTALGLATVRTQKAQEPAQPPEAVAWDFVSVRIQRLLAPATAQDKK